METPKVSTTFRRIIALTVLAIAVLCLLYACLGDHADVRASRVLLICCARINWVSLALKDYIKNHPELDDASVKSVDVAKMCSIAMQFHDDNPKLFHDKYGMLFHNSYGRKPFDDNTYRCPLSTESTPNSGGYVWAENAFELMLGRSRGGEDAEASIVMCHECSCLHRVTTRTETILLMSDGVVRHIVVEPRLYCEWVDSKFRKGVTTLSEFNKVQK